MKNNSCARDTKASAASSVSCEGRMLSFSPPAVRLLYPQASSFHKVTEGYSAPFVCAHPFTFTHLDTDSIGTQIQ